MEKKLVVFLMALLPALPLFAGKYTGVEINYIYKKVYGDFVGTRYVILEDSYVHSAEYATLTKALSSSSIEDVGGILNERVAELTSQMEATDNKGLKAIYRQSIEELKKAARENLGESAGAGDSVDYKEIIEKLSRKSLGGRIYTAVMELNRDYWAVTVQEPDDDTYDDMSGGYQWGVIDPAGNTVIPFRYKPLFIYGCLEPVLMYNTHDKLGVFDYSGKQVIPFKYEEIFKIHAGLLVSEKKGGTMYYGVVDLNDNQLLPLIYEYILSDRNVLWVSKFNGEGVALFDKNLRQVTARWYDKIYSFSKHYVAIADGKYYYISKKTLQVEKTASELEGYSFGEESYAMFAE